MTQIQSGNDALGNPFVIYQGTFNHCYPSQGPYTAYFETCCRISGLQNTGQTYFGWSTVVDMRNGNKFSPISAVPATVTIPVSSTYQLVVPLIDGDGDIVTCSLLSGTSTSPSTYSNSNFALTIDSSTCTLTLNNFNGGTMYIAVTVEISDNHPSAPSTSTLDFIIVSTPTVTSTPPTCDQITVGPVYVTPGGTAAIDFQVNDSDGGALTLSHQGTAPTGISFAPLSAPAGSQITVTYSPPLTWTGPATTGSVVITDPDNLFAYCLYSFNFNTMSVSLTPSSTGVCNTFSACGPSSITLSSTVSGGVAPYSYSWNTGATSPNLVVNSVGPYSVTVADSASGFGFAALAVSQTTAQAHTLSAPPVLGTCAGTPIHVSSCSSSSASLTFTRSGGCGNLQVSIPGITPSGGTTVSGSTYSFPVSSSGTYQATVVDADGCSFSTNTASVNYQGALVGSVTVSGDGIIYDIRRFGTSTASASVSISSGCGPYTYSWSTGSTASSVSSLAAGSYSVTVTDALGCPSVFNFVVTQPPSALSVTFSVPSANVCGHVGACFGDEEGEIEVTPSGGSGGYTISWTSSSSTTPSNGDFNPTNLDDGNYQFTVVDANGDSYTSGVIALAESADLVTVLDSNPNGWTCNSVQCNGDGGELLLSVSGGCAPYTILWSGPTAIPAGTLNPTNLAVGAYSVTVTDANGCGEVLSATISQPPLLQVTTSANTVGSCGQHVSCKGVPDGSIVSSVSGGCGSSAPSWSPSGQTVQNPTSLSAGTHTVTYTDQNGCQRVSSVNLVEASVALDVSLSLVACSGQLQATISGGTLCGGFPSYQYTWSFLSSDGSSTSCASLSPSSTTQSNLCDGVYTIEVTDGNGCTVSASRTVGGLKVLDAQSAFNSASWTQMSGVWAVSANLATQTNPATGLLSMLRFNDAQAFSIPGISGEFRTPVSGNAFGLILGYNTGNSHYYMLEWMGSGGSTACGSSTPAGLRLLSVPTTATACQIRTRTSGVTVLQDAFRSGSAAWSALTTHTFTVTYSASSVYVTIDGNGEIAFFPGGSDPQPLDGNVILFTSELGGVSFSNIAMDSTSSGCPDPSLVTITKTFTDSVTCDGTTYLVKVDWGDGTVENFGSSVFTSYTTMVGGQLEVSHDYDTNGVYTVEICMSSPLQPTPSCDTLIISVNDIIELLTGLTDNMRWNMYVPRTITWSTVNVLPDLVSIDWYYSNMTHFRNMGTANTAEGHYDSIGPHMMYTGEYYLDMTFHGLTCHFKNFPYLIHVRTGDWDPL